MLVQGQVMSSTAFRLPGSQATSHELRLDASRATSQVPNGQSNGLSDEQSAFLQSAFQRSGGLASSDHMALFLRSHCDQPVSMLARWIVRRQLVGFVWRSQTLIPMFQVDLQHCSVRAGIPETIAELTDAFDDVETITWFATPNSWLSGAAPADLVASDMQAVLQAARADRFVALG